MTISISGTVYVDSGVTAMGSNRHVNVSVNGAASAGEALTGADGTYSLAGITAASGAVLTLYLQGDSENAVTVTKSTGVDMTGVDLYQDHLNLRSDNGVALTAANLNTSDANGATGISAIYSAPNSTTLTLVSAKTLYVMSGQSYTIGAAVTVTANGDFINKGTVNGNGSTLVLKSTSPSAVFDPGVIGGAGYANVTHFNKVFKAATQTAPKDYRKEGAQTL